MIWSMMCAFLVGLVMVIAVMGIGLGLITLVVFIFEHAKPLAWLILIGLVVLAVATIYTVGADFCMETGWCGL